MYFSLYLIWWVYVFYAQSLRRYCNPHFIDRLPFDVLFMSFIPRVITIVLLLRAAYYFINGRKVTAFRFIYSCIWWVFPFFYDEAERYSISLQPNESKNRMKFLAVDGGNMEPRMFKLKEGGVYTYIDESPFFYFANGATWYDGTYKIAGGKIIVHDGYEFLNDTVDIIRDTLGHPVSIKCYYQKHDDKWDREFKIEKNELIGDSLIESSR